MDANFTHKNGFIRPFQNTSKKCILGYIIFIFFRIRYLQNDSGSASGQKLVSYCHKKICFVNAMISVLMITLVS